MNSNEKSKVKNEDEKSYEALVEAYESLKADYAKRGKQIAEMEEKLATPHGDGDDGEIKEHAAHGEQMTDFEEFLLQFPEADAEGVIEGAVSSGDFAKGTFTRQYVRSLRDKIAALEAKVEDEEFITQKALESKEASEAIIKEYLRQIAKTKAGHRVIAASSAPAVPPSRPRSIAEAGMLAGDIFTTKF